MYLFTWYIYWKTVLFSQKMHTYSPNYVIFMCSAVLRNHLEASLAIWVYRIGPLAITQRFILWNIFLGFFLITSNFSFGLGLLDSVLFSFVFPLTPKFLSYTIFFYIFQRVKVSEGWLWVRAIFHVSPPSCDLPFAFPVNSLFFRLSERPK